MSNNSSLKATLRTIVRSRLETHQATRSTDSTRIWNHLVEIDVFNLAQKRETLMCYVDFRDEVETTRFFTEFFCCSMIVPFCDGNEIVPFRLRMLDELEPGYKGIPEPKVSLRSDPMRIVLPETIELAIVPGLAFDRKGKRLGRGAGFYDRFLPKLPSAAIVIGLAFECQVFDSIPTEPHDRAVNILVTESTVRYCMSSFDEGTGETGVPTIFPTPPPLGEG